MDKSEYIMELFGVDIDLRTILSDVQLEIRCSDFPLTQEENNAFANYIQKACEIAVRGMHRKLMSSQEDDE